MRSIPTETRPRRHLLTSSAALLAALFCAAAAAAPLLVQDCGVCTHAPVLLRILAAVAAFFWIGVSVASIRINRALDPSEALRRLSITSLAATCLHGGFVMEAFGAACAFCLLALLCEVATTVFLVHGVVPEHRLSLVPPAAVALLSGALCAWMASPASADSPRGILPATRPELRAVVSIVTPGCPLCRRFVEQSAPQLRQVLGDRYELLWLFNPDDADQVRFVRASLGHPDEAALRAHLLRAAAAVDYYRSGPFLEVPLTLIDTQSDHPERIGKAGVAQIIARARARLGLEDSQ